MWRSKAVEFQPGNKFWEVRSSHGRKPKFETPESLWDAAVEYFNWVDENPLSEAKPFAFQGQSWIETVPKMRAMTLDGLCLFLDITDQTFYNYRDKSTDFLEVVGKIDKVIRSQKFAGAAADLLNPNIIARDLGLTDKREQSITVVSGDLSDAIGDLSAD